MKKIAINGFGRIGRDFFRLSLQENYKNNLEVIAINDLGDLENLAYLLKYDTVYGRLDKKVEFFVKEDKNYLRDGDREILVCCERDPKNLPWGELAIDVVVESTGLFITKESAQAHIDAGAKRVVMSAPAKDDTPTTTPGLREEILMNNNITSNASCTTNATNPVVAVIHETLGIKKAMLSTVHAYTSTQSLVDGMATKDLRRGRAAAQNIIPSSTGAAKAVAQVIPELGSVFDGVAIRVPVISGSLIDLTMIVGRDTNVEEINQILTEAAENSRWHGILGVTRDQIVSSDVLGMEYGSLVSLDLTQVVDRDMVKVMAWYDNEWSYTSMLMKHVVQICNIL